MWEEGRFSASRVIRLSVLACTVVIGLDLLLTHHLSAVFGVAFPLICLAAALAVRPKDFFQIGVLPPLLMAAVMAALSGFDRAAIARVSDGFAQGLITGLTNHAVSLLIAYSLCLAVLAIRQRFLALRRREAEAHAAAVHEAAAHSKGAGSPAPTRTTSGAPAEKSTTVVGNEPHSPESRTASTW